MILVTVVANLAFYLMADKNFDRFGPDTTAYINQAGQFAMGQTNYWSISSGQGPCYYPAGHLWHYLPIYHAFTQTDYGE